MTTINASRVTILDIVKSMDPSGKLLPVAEVLAKTNPMLLDMPWVESNLPTSNIVTVRSSLPTASFTRINKGTAATKATTEQLEDTMGRLDMVNEVHDALEVVAAGNLAAYRWKQDSAFIEAMNQKVENTIIYGDERTDSASFTGLMPRFNSLTGTYGGQIVDGGGTSTDNSSMWAVDWGEDTVFGIHPPGTPAGLQAEDMGRLRVTDSSNNPFWAWCSRFVWTCGLSVENYKHVARVANIDISDLSDAGDSGYDGANLITLLIKLLHKLDPQNGRSRVIYANETVLTALDLIAQSKSNLALSWENFGGQQVLSFRGIPIRRCDQLAINESRVT